MNRTLRIADLVAAVGGIVLLVSSFLRSYAGPHTKAFSAWSHLLLINQLVVTDILGLLIGLAAVLVSLRVLPDVVREWLAPAAVVVLMSAIFGTVANSTLIATLATAAGQPPDGVGAGIGFYLGIVGAAVLVVGTALAWLPGLSTSLVGRNREPVAAEPGYQGPTTFPGAPGQPTGGDYGTPAPSTGFAATPPPTRAQASANPWGAPSPGATAVPAPDPAPAPSPWAAPSLAASPEPAGAQPAAAQPMGAQPGWGEQRAETAPPAPFSPFWAAVPTSRTVYNPDHTGSSVGYLQPGTWYAVVAQHSGGGLVVQLPNGGHGVLVETSDLIRG